MSNRIYETDKNLTAAEAVIMKVVWSTSEDIAVQGLMQILRTQYQKDYVRTTIATFLSKLAEKGFVQTYREGRISYVHALRTEDEYRKKLLREEADFWFQGDVFQVITALYGKENLQGKEEKLRRLLDDFDH